VQIPERADDRAARHGGDHLHAPKHAELGEPREHADVEERRTEPASGERQSELRAVGLHDSNVSPPHEVVKSAAFRG
jgi:hypothetical protein